MATIVVYGPTSVCAEWDWTGEPMPRKKKKKAPKIATEQERRRRINANLSAIPRSTRRRRFQNTRTAEINLQGRNFAGGGN